MRVPSQTKQQASQHCEISLLSSARRQRKEDIFTFSVTNIGLQKIRRGIPFQKLRVPEQMRLCKTGGEYTTQKPHTHIHTHTHRTLRLAASDLRSRARSLPTPLKSFPLPSLPPTHTPHSLAPVLDQAMHAIRLLAPTSLAPSLSPPPPTHTHLEASKPSTYRYRPSSP